MSLLLVLLALAGAPVPIVDARYGYQLSPGPFRPVKVEAPPPELLHLLKGPRGEVAIVTRTEGPSPEDPAAAVKSLEAGLAATPGFRGFTTRRPLVWGRPGDQLFGLEVTYRTADAAVVARYLFYSRSVVGLAVETRGRQPSAAARALVRSFQPPR